MVSPETAMLSVFITPWMKPTMHPARHQLRLALHHRVEQREVLVLPVGEIRIVPGDHVVGEPA